MSKKIAGTARNRASPIRDEPDPMQAFARAQSFERAGRAVDAERIYRTLLESYPNEIALLHSLASLLQQRGELIEAENLLRHAVAASPNHDILLITFGTLLAANRKFVEAESVYRRALALKSGSAELHYNFGVLLEQLERRDEALIAYRSAVAIDPTNAKSYTRIGALLNERKDYESALSSIGAALEAEPDSFDAHYYQGWIFSNLRWHDEALTAFDRAAALQPGRLELTLARANALRDAGRHDQALDAYWRALEQDPGRSATHVEINSLAWSWGRHDLYLKSFACARERLGDQHDLLQAEAIFHMRNHAWTEAEKLLRRAYASAPERGDTAGLLARALAGGGRFDESYDLFATAIEAESEAAIHRQELGFTLLRDHQFTQALYVFQQGLLIHPFDQLLLAGLATAYRLNGDSRYHTLVDFSKYVRSYEIKAPLGYTDVDSFNRSLAEVLDGLHAAKREPIDQTLRGGTQTIGHLFTEKNREIELVHEGIQLALDDYIRNLPDDPTHPMRQQAQSDFALQGAWSCRLASGGYHNNHVHPHGWISSAYYVRLPDQLDDPLRRPGWLAFGRSAFDLGEDDRIEHAERPQVGKLVLFPSFYWHGTVPFGGTADRLAIAFDAVPR